MTTAGTSQFNLLSLEEIRLFNKSCVDNFNETIIIGIPPLSERHTLEEVEWYNNNIDRDNVYLMLLYPDRFYNTKNIYNFFDRIARISELGIYVHGMFMRKGTGGMYDFDHTLISEMASHDNIWGMKEETVNLADAFTQCLKSDINHKDFEVIVAGGSQKRFWYLHPVGATNFLTGIGSMFPQIDIDFYNTISKGNYNKAKDIMVNDEGVLFKTFMEIGWHKSMREALKILGFSKGPDRRPFASATPTESKIIKKILTQINYEKNLDTRTVFY